MKHILSIVFIVLSVSLHASFALKDLFKLHLWDKFKKTHGKLLSHF
jgi:hypothetical protein